MRAATCSKTANSIRICDFARLTLCDNEIFASHGSPRHIGRTRASAAIDAMTIDQSKRPTLQHVSCPAANASTSELHKIRLAHSNPATDRSSLLSAHDVLHQRFEAWIAAKIVEEWISREEEQVAFIASRKAVLERLNGTFFFT